MLLAYSPILKCAVAAFLAFLKHCSITNSISKGISYRNALQKEQGTG